MKLLSIEEGQQNSDSVSAGLLKQNVGQSKVQAFKQVALSSFPNLSSWY